MLDVLIVGAGPHALILATLLMNPNQHVNTSSPEILQGVQLSKTNPKTGQTKSKNRSVDTLSELHKDPKCPACPPLIFKVVDSYGEWASLWESQFTTLNIPHLRSHMLVHTNPLNKKALQEFVLAEDRLAELHSLPEKVYIQDKNAFFNDGRLGKQNSKLLSAAKGLQKNLYFSLPGTQLSVDFFKDQVCRYNLDHVLIKGTVDRITPLLSGKEKKVEFFQVTLDTGDTLEAKRVVLATGPTREQMANIPPWVRAITESYPEERLQHTVELMHHLAQHKSEGSRFTGPPAVCHRNQRVMVIGGGLSSAHIISMALQQGANEVTWVLRKHVQVTEAVWCYETQKWKVFLDDNGEKWTGDRIWLATGCKLDVNQDPLLSDIKKHFPVQVLEGWPCISETLQWAPACPVYLMGQYAALQVGPHAVNLAGGQAAAFRIAKDIIDEHSRKKKNTENNKVEKTQTEEYISHMHGLMWL
ncbi:uncharacterized protein zgc:113276 isoform X3 [Tachysurus fulvidraco]|uniref:uncharacterized protein zgc:113276 isoform X3 n=1 Tax=Tachysurus fulvidraco TaxID=1234273 RepID=UPI001FEDF84B|nr:uncharacterized protein zgc:113276 isoform X3 [Tachysurus fulvidraco]